MTTRERLKKANVLHTTDRLRLHRLTMELDQQAPRERRRLEDEIREELRDSRARTITAATQKSSGCDQ
jgi:hypothetical protein